MRTKVLLVEDSGLVREHWKVLLSDAGYEVTAFCCGEDALIWSKCNDFDVGIIDIGLPGISGLVLLRDLRKRFAEARFLVLTAIEDSDVIVEALRSGARGYVLKDTQPAEVLTCISNLLGGQPALGAGISDRLVLHLNQEGLEESSAHNEPLTPREREVLGLLARGMTYSEVGSALSIGVGTVQTYVKSIYGKLGVSSKTEATALAIKKKLI